MESVRSVISSTHPTFRNTKTSRREGKRIIEIFPKINVPTPFGKVNLPALDMPDIKKPHIDQGRKEALKHSVGSDLSMVVSLIPVVGDLVGQFLEDVHVGGIFDRLTPQEIRLYTKYNKIYPLNTLALLRTFMESPLKK